MINHKTYHHKSIFMRAKDACDSKTRTVTVLEKFTLNNTQFLVHPSFIIKASTFCGQSFSFSIIENSRLHQKISVKKNLF